MQMEERCDSTKVGRSLALGALTLLIDSSVVLSCFVAMSQLTIFTTSHRRHF